MSEQDAYLIPAGALRDLLENALLDHVGISYGPSDVATWDLDAIIAAFAPYRQQPAPDLRYSRAEVERIVRQAVDPYDARDILAALDDLASARTGTQEGE